MVEHDVDRLRWQVEAQRRRVETDVRLRFYKALAAQRRLEQARVFQQNAARAVEIAAQRRFLQNWNEAVRPLPPGWRIISWDQAKRELQRLIMEQKERIQDMRHKLESDSKHWSTTTQPILQEFFLFHTLAQTLAQQIAIRNANHAPTQKVQMNS